MSRYTQSMTQALQQVDDRTQEFDEAIKWEVKIKGLPTFYSDGKSRGEVKQALRKLLKRPDDIESIERTTPAELKKIRRGQAAGSEPDDEEEDEKVKEEVKINRIIQAQNEDLSVDDVVNMIQFGHPFKVAEDIPAELPPGPNIPRYKNASNATVDKEDKKANKIKDKIEKGSLIPTQTKENKLPPHLAKFFDKKGNPNPEAAKRMAAGRKKREEPKIKDVTPKGYGPKEEVEIEGVDVYGDAPKRKQHPGQKKGTAKLKKGWKMTPSGEPYVKKEGRAALEKDKKKQNKDPVGPQHEMAERWLKKLREVAPPGWGHTVAKKEKTKPDKPKSKIGGTAQAMKKAQERGDIPKDMNIYALMWSMKNKGDNPHYKPGEKDVKKKKYKKDESVLDSAKRYVIDERADWETAFKSASQSRPAMKYKDAAAFIDTAGLSSTEKRTALKSAKKWLK